MQNHILIIICFWYKIQETLTLSILMRFWWSKKSLGLFFRDEFDGAVFFKKRFLVSNLNFFAKFQSPSFWQCYKFFLFSLKMCYMLTMMFTIFTGSTVQALLKTSKRARLRKWKQPCDTICPMSWLKPIRRNNEGQWLINMYTMFIMVYMIYH